MTKIRAHKGDLADLRHYDVEAVAIDTETLGLNPLRDRLCVVQLSPGDGSADVVQIAPGQKRAEPRGAVAQPEDHEDLPLRPL
jgi:ribonuclease D